MLAVVNRRNSDLVEKADGVLYTSDGRDVEMSVASTKAFYAQVAAGFLLSLAIAREVGGRRPHGDRTRSAHRAAGAARRPEEVLAARPEIAAAAWAHAPARRHWAVVGNGPEPAGGVGAAHQAVGAGLQVDRLRRHRGQEAHRPVVGAADPGLRRRAAAGGRGRRRQGTGHLPGPQGRARRHRHPGHRRRLPAGAGRRRGAGGAPAAGLRAVGHGRPPLRLRGGAGHRRPGPEPAGDPGRGGGRRGRRRRAPRTPAGPAGPPDGGRRPGLPRRGCATAPTTAPSRRERPYSWPRCCATPPGRCRSSSTSSTTAGSARPAWSWRTSPPP